MNTLLLEGKSLSHGRSSHQAGLTSTHLAEDIRDIITHLSLVKPILIGWSLAGMMISKYHQLCMG